MRITAQQLSYMIVNGEKIAHKVAIILEASEGALKRHFADFGIEPTGTFSDIDDFGRNYTQFADGQNRDSHLNSIHKVPRYQLMSEQVLCDNTLSYISVSTHLSDVCSLNKPEKDYCRLASRTVI